MTFIQETKACESCAKSKRKCGKERPKCHRCSSRDLKCEYPPARPSSFVLLQDDTETPQSCDTSATAVQDADLWSPSMLFGPLPGLYVSLASSDMDLQLNRPLPASRNMPLAIGSCHQRHGTLKRNIRQIPASSHQTQPTPPFGNGVLRRFLQDIQRRLQGWVSTGGTTFIHKQLYTFRSPRCILDARTALALYLCRTDENQDMVFHTLEDRAKQLLVEEEKHRTSSSHDAFTHLARVQALLTYQVLGLLHGDIRQRALAEDRMETLMTWLGQMVDSVELFQLLFLTMEKGIIVVAKGLGLGIKDVLPENPKMINDITKEEVVWHILDFAESLRRTWIISQGLHTTYQALKKGWAMCPGSMKVTAGQGMWDAPSSHAWTKVLRETNVWFIEGWRRTCFHECSAWRGGRIYEIMHGDTYGMEKMERWQSESVFALHAHG